MTLETEDPAAIAANTRSWFDYYRPLSPGAAALVAICARMDVMINRSYTYLDNALLMQGRNTREAWEAARAAHLASLVPLVTTAPDSGVIEDLKDFGHGLRWLIEQITCFQTLIEQYGFLPPEAWRDLARLLGADPDIDRLGKNETAYMIVQYALRSEPRPDEALIASLSATERRPEALRQVDLAAIIPGPEGCRYQLKSMVAREVNELRVLEEGIRNGKDKADLEVVLKEATILAEGDQSKQFLRYHKESCSKLFRALGDLPAILKRDASGFYDELAAAAEEAMNQREEAVAAGPGVAPAAEAAVADPATGGTGVDFPDDPSDGSVITKEPHGVPGVAEQDPGTGEPSVGIPTQPVFEPSVSRLQPEVSTPAGPDVTAAVKAAVADPATGGTGVDFPDDPSDGSVVTKEPHGVPGVAERNPGPGEPSVGTPSQLPGVEPRISRSQHRDVRPWKDNERLGRRGSTPLKTHHNGNSRGD